MELNEIISWVNYLNSEAMKANKAFGNTGKYAVTTRLWSDSFDVFFWIGEQFNNTMSVYFATGGSLDEKAEQKFEEVEFAIAEFKVNCLNVKAC